jgi:hypothetical protein
MATKKKLPLATPELFEGATLMRMITRNIKFVRYIDITLNDTLTLIGGDNEQGKSSFLDGFGFCMRGKLAIQMQPIRNGQQEGSVQCDFGDGKKVSMSVLRTLKRLGDSEFTSEVDVEIPGHVAPSRIEEFLKSLTSQYASDPMAFDELEDAQRLEALQKLVGGFDFKAHAEKRKKIFDRRTEFNRDKDREQSAADATMVRSQPPCELVDESALTRELQEAGQKNTDRANRAAHRQRGADRIAQLRASADTVPSRITAATDERREEFKRFEEQENQRIASLTEQVQLLVAQIENARQGITTASARVADSIEADIRKLNEEATQQRAEADAIEQKIKDAGELPEETDTAAISDKLDQARTTNAQHAAWKQLRDRKAEHQKLANEHASESDALTKQLDALDAEKLKAIDEAKLPVSGLGFGDGYVTLQASDGSGPVPWRQASEALRMDTSFALAIALNPKLKIILIRNGSNVGKRIRQRIQERAAEKGYRVILEVVEEGEGTHVVIEDGQVKARESKGAAA